MFEGILARGSNGIAVYDHVEDAIVFNADHYAWSDMWADI